MAVVTVPKACTNASKTLLLSASGTRRSYIIYNPGPLAVALFFNTQTTPFASIVSDGSVTASIAQGDTMDTIKGLLAGAGPQDIDVTEA